MDQAVALKDMETDQVLVDQAKTTVTTQVVTETTEVPTQALLNTLITTTDLMIWDTDLVKVWELLDMVDDNENLKMISNTKILQ
jgi:hypothetical protein